MNGKNKRPINVDKEAFEQFDKQYPSLKELFLTRCLILASQKPDFFQQVFFDPMFIEVK